MIVQQGGLLAQAASILLHIATNPLNRYCHHRK